MIYEFLASIGKEKNQNSLKLRASIMAILMKHNIKEFFLVPRTIFSYVLYLSKCQEKNEYGNIFSSFF